MSNASVALVSELKLSTLIMDDDFVPRKYEINELSDRQNHQNEKILPFSQHFWYFEVIRILFGCVFEGFFMTEHQI